MSQMMNQGHANNRAVLRILGPILVLVGLIFIIVGVSSFFGAFNSSLPTPGHSFGNDFGQTTASRGPSNFWCAFVGAPILFVGIVMCKFAFLGSVMRYAANEVAPVGSDVVNYMATNTRGAVKTVASAIGEGLAQGGTPQATGTQRCHKCNEDNAADAKFCKECGETLVKSRPCNTCGEQNDADAKFCDNCGKPLA